MISIIDSDADATGNIPDEKNKNANVEKDAN